MSEAVDRLGHAATYTCRGRPNYVAVGLGALFACVMFLDNGFSPHHPRSPVFLFACLTLATVVCVGGLLAILNMSITLRDDRIEWTDWSGGHHSCPNGDIRMTPVINGRAAFWVMRSMQGDILLITSQYQDRDEIACELRHRALANGDDLPLNDPLFLRDGALLVVVGVAILVALAYDLSIGEIGLRGGQVLRAGQTSYTVAAFVFGALGLAAIGFGSWQYRNR